MYQIAICILIKFWQYQFPGMYMYYYISIYILEIKLLFRLLWSLWSLLLSYK